MRCGPLPTIATAAITLNGSTWYFSIAIHGPSVTSAVATKNVRSNAGDTIQMRGGVAAGALLAGRAAGAVVDTIRACSLRNGQARNPRLQSSQGMSQKPSEGGGS